MSNLLQYITSQLFLHWSQNVFGLGHRGISVTKVKEIYSQVSLKPLYWCPLLFLVDILLFFSLFNNILSIPISCKESTLSQSRKITHLHSSVGGVPNHPSPISFGLSPDLYLTTVQILDNMVELTSTRFFRFTDESRTGSVYVGRNL